MQDNQYSQAKHESRVLEPTNAVPAVDRPVGAYPIAGHKGPTLLEALVPGITWRGKVLAMVGFMLLTAACAVWGRFYLPDNPVPVTLQTFAIILTGGVLGWRLGLGSALLYWLVAIAYAPILAGGTGGPAVVFGVTGGYLIGFMLASLAAGWLSQNGANRWNSIWAMLIGGAMVYVPALIWLSVFDFGWPEQGKLLSSALYPFVVGDLIKVVVASLILAGAWKISDRRRDLTHIDNRQ